MRVSIHKPTGRLIEMQSHATAGTLIKNAVAGGYKESDLEERAVTDADYAALVAVQPVSAQTKIAAEEAKAPVSQRFLREALMYVAEKYPEIKASPGYQKIAAAEAKIVALRSQP